MRIYLLEQSKKTPAVANALKIHGDHADFPISAHELQIIGTVKHRGISNTRGLMNPYAERARVFGETLGDASTLGDDSQGPIKARSCTPCRQLGGGTVWAPCN